MGAAGVAAGQGGAIKKLRTIKIYKKQNNRKSICLLLFSNNVDIKNNNRNYKKKHSEFSGWANSCDKFVSIRS